jgi:NAD(P)-dependent dehydrogenase (short-subunit alcohol dehydrogenase family)
MSEAQNRVVMISGAAGNLGRAVAKTFAAEGANLVLLDRRPGRLGSVLPKIAADHRHLLLESVDVTNEASVVSAAKAVIERFGRIEVLVNTAGGFRSGTAVHQTTLEDWEHMIALNARSAFLASRAVVPHMLRQESGVIINIGARPGMKGMANAAAYSASKGAVIRLTESLSAELKRKGIRVNVVLPGTLDTPQNREAMPNAKHDRWVSPEAVAEVIRFLASDAARGIHGEAIPVYGLG